jgi:hypothetical protein
MNQQLLAGGPPPLTVEAADCALTVIDIMAAIVRGVDLIDVTPQVRQDWRNYLANAYPNLAPQDRAWVANTPAQLRELQHGWSAWPPAVREQIRQTWAVALPGILNFVAPVVATGQPAYGYEGVAAYQSPAYYLPAHAAPAYHGGDESVADILARIQHGQQQAEEQARGRSQEEYLQVKLQNDSLNAQMLSNISRMQYESMKAITSNFKA